MTPRLERMLAIAETYRVAGESSVTVRLVDFAAARQAIDLRKSFAAFRSRPRRRSPSQAFSSVERPGASIRPQPRQGISDFLKTPRNSRTWLIRFARPKASQTAALFEQAVETLRELSGTDANPFGEAIVQSLEESQGMRRVVVAPTADAAAHVERLLHNDVSLTILTRTQLADLAVSEYLVLVGSPGWTPTRRSRHQGRLWSSLSSTTGCGIRWRLRACSLLRRRV